MRTPIPTKSIAKIIVKIKNPFSNPRFVRYILPPPPKTEDSPPPRCCSRIINIRATETRIWAIKITCSMVFTVYPKSREKSIGDLTRFKFFPSHFWPDSFRFLRLPPRGTRCGLQKVSRICEAAFSFSWDLSLGYRPAGSGIVL